MTFIDDDGNELQFNGSFAMTKQAVSFFNGTIKGDVSITFSLDNNSYNRKVLGYNGPQMINQVAWTKQPFNRFRNGNLIDRGYIVIQSDEGKTLKCFYTSGNSNWLQLLDGLITELDYSGALGTDYRTAISSTNILASRSHNYGVVFPFADWIYNGDKASQFWAGAKLYDKSGTDQGLIMEQYPCFYLHSLVEEISRQKNIKFSGDLLEDGIYKSIVLSSRTGQIKRDNVRRVSANGTSFSISATGAPGDTYNLFTDVTDVDDQMTSTTFTANRNSRVKITLEIPASSASLGQVIRILIQGTSSLSGTTIASNPGGNFAEAYTYDITMTSGQTIFFGVRKTAGTASITLNVKFDVPTYIGVGDYVSPSDFLSPIPCIDVIKYLVNRFCCVSYFNEFSKTLNLNIFDNFKKEDAYDWSQYYVSYKSSYTESVAKNNYIRLNQPQNDIEIDVFNKKNKVRYGDGNIETSINLKNERDLLTLPFSPSSYIFSKSGEYLSNTPLVTLVNDEVIPYSGRGNDGVASYYSPVDTTITFKIGEIVRVIDDNLGDLGLMFIRRDNGAGTWGVNHNLPAASTTGKIYRQVVQFHETSSRELIHKTNGQHSEISSSGSYYFYNETFNSGSFTPSTETSIAPAWFSKSVTGLGIDATKSNLAFDNVSDKFQDPTFKELYFNNVSKIFNNPPIEAVMLLPDSIYQAYNFDRFIYLKTKDLTGYFFVDSIENYVDGNTPVEVNLYML